MLIARLQVVSNCGEGQTRDFTLTCETCRSHDAKTLLARVFSWYRRTPVFCLLSCLILAEIPDCLRSSIRLKELRSVNEWRAFLKRPENYFTGPKAFVKLRPAYSVKLVFLYVVLGIKVKITPKFRDTKHLRFEDTKRIMSLGKFRVFRETGPRSAIFSSDKNKF